MMFMQDKRAALVFLVSKVSRAELAQLVLKDSPDLRETRVLVVQTAHQANRVSLELSVRKACEETLEQLEHKDSVDPQDLLVSRDR